MVASRTRSYRVNVSFGALSRTSAIGRQANFCSWREMVISLRFMLLCLSESPEKGADSLPNRRSHCSLDNHICDLRRAR